MKDRLMRFVFAVVIGVTFSVQSATPTQPMAPKWYPGMVSAAYQSLCNNTLGGVYVNDNPSFSVAWSCRGIDWCEQRPDTLGCPSVEPR